MPVTDFETVRRAMKIFNGFDGPSCDELWWRTDSQYAPVTLLVNCNDLFAWGCSDAEELEAADLPILEQAVADAKVSGDETHGALLWIARKRGMRPQGAFYKYFEPPFAALMDACGEKRDTGFGNPNENIPKQTVKT